MAVPTCTVYKGLTTHLQGESPHLTEGLNMSRGLQTMKQGTRIVFMGQARVGKTAIIKRFLNNTFQQEHVETVEDMYRTSFKSCQMDLLDTTGSYHFPVMRDYAIVTGDVFVLVFEWNDDASLDYVRALLDKIRSMTETKANVIVVANKTDEDNASKSFVETEMVISMDWECVFHSCSAKTGQCVYELFEKIVRAVPDRKSSVGDTSSKLKQFIDIFKGRRSVQEDVP